MGSVGMCSAAAIRRFEKDRDDKVLNHLKMRGAACAFIETNCRGYGQRFYESTGFRVEGKVVWLRKKMQKFT